MENIKTQTTNTCPMCCYYDSPGFVRNADQVIACWQCNPSNQKGLVAPSVLCDAGPEDSVERLGYRPTQGGAGDSVDRFKAGR